jgi:hypothetical protein
MLNSLITIDKQLNYFNDIVVMIAWFKFNNAVYNAVKLHADDTLWMSPQFKDLN